MSSRQPAATPVPATFDPWARYEPPGGVLVWIVVFVELITFLAGIGVFLYQRADDPESFARGRELLDQPLALLNTSILLTGGWFMACAITELRQGDGDRSLRWTVAAIASGLAFLIVKSIEYAGKIDQGHTFGEDPFFTLYYALTGFHFIHVAVAVAILVYFATQIRQGRYHRDDCDDVEAGGIFWHLCDLIWLFLFPTLYLL
jgi:nitric oxide reductase NorE protein